MFLSSLLFQFFFLLAFTLPFFFSFHIKDSNEKNSGRYQYNWSVVSQPAYRSYKGLNKIRIRSESIRIALYLILRMTGTERNSAFFSLPRERERDIVWGTCKLQRKSFRVIPHRMDPVPLASQREMKCWVSCVYYRRKFRAFCCCCL